MHISAQSVTNRQHHRNGISAAETTVPPVAEYHFAAGILMAIQNKLDAAVRCYQQASASMTDQLGVTEWMAGYLLDSDPARSHGPHLLFRIYENMGRCLFQLGRRVDARFAVDAALELNPGSAPVRRLSDQINSANPTRSSSGSSVGNKSIATQPTGRSFTDQLTLVMNTHFTDKLIENKHLAPPGTGLIQSTYTSMLKVFGAGLNDCPKRLIYDFRNPINGQEAKYQRNLETFAGEHGFDLLITQRGGLQRNLVAAIEAVRTPYILWVEHDWEFMLPPTALADILAVFDNHPTVNVIRFNKRSNAIAGYDFLMEKETRIKELDLIRTAAYSNNPQVMRVEKMRRDWLPICLSDTISKQYDLGESAFGIEEPLFKNLMQDIRRMGFAKAHAGWGNYVYGRINAPPAIRHLGC